MVVDLARWSTGAGELCAACDDDEDAVVLAGDRGSAGAEMEEVDFSAAAAIAGADSREDEGNPASELEVHDSAISSEASAHCSDFESGWSEAHTPS